MARSEQPWWAWGGRTGRVQGGHGRFAAVCILGVGLVFGLLVSGCADIKIRMGSRPDVDALERSLRIGKSTRADVGAVLGMPFGKGRAMLPVDPKATTVWSYYYEEGNLTDIRRVMLFVYFDEDRYDGYMWFSSLPK
jgi:hypothetical protein